MERCELCGTTNSVLLDDLRGSIGVFAGVFWIDSIHGDVAVILFLGMYPPAW